MVVGGGVAVPAVMVLSALNAYGSTVDSMEMQASLDLCRRFVTSEDVGIG